MIRRPNPMSRSAQRMAARWVLRTLSALWLLVLVSILAGCGGGGEPEPDQTAQPVDCRARPEACR